MTRDPFRTLERRALTLEDRFTRHQLKPILLLDAALRGGLGLSKERAREVLGRLVSEIGAVFIGANMGRLTPERWAALDTPGRERMSAEIMARFFNMTAEVAEPPGSQSFAFEVTALLLTIAVVGAVLLARRPKGDLAPLPEVPPVGLIPGEPEPEPEEVQ